MGPNMISDPIPSRALPRFGAGAFRGSIAPSSTPVDDRDITAPEPVAIPIGPTAGIRAVNVTGFSAGNSFRAGVVGMLEEWWRWRTPMSDEIYVGPPQTRSIERAMAPPRRLTKVVANRRTFYEAPEYGQPSDVFAVETGEDLADEEPTLRERVSRWLRPR